MNSKIIITVIAIVIVSVIIYLIKNKNELEDILKKKSGKVIKILIVIIVITGMLEYNFRMSRKLKNSCEMLRLSQELEITSKEYDNRKEQEHEYYINALQKEYGELEKNPYIPEGFGYVEGDVNSGFVIQDMNQNQYVWVPCTNKENENIVKLQKKDFYLQAGIKHYDCLDTEYEDFINSALINGGFYISRYEIGMENENIVSKASVPVLTYISKKEAMELINNMYTNESINCKLINGYAYDTTLEWIEKSNNISIDKYQFNKDDNVLTGRSKYNNIYDFIDNVMEISTEEFYDTVIYRGFDHDNEITLDSRYNILEDSISSYNEKLRLLAYRTIIYK